LDKLDAGSEFGDCRYNPPTIISSLAGISLNDSRTERDEVDCWDQYLPESRSHITEFPATHYSDWCGKHSEKGTT
jgi:hypothetical protein